MRPVYVAAALRTAVVPVNGAFKALSVADLASPVIQRLCADTGLAITDIEQVLLGNALYGGGNPARLIALAAGIPEHRPAMTLDTQCCAGLDSFRLGAQAIATGQADIVLVGGVESTSRRAIRLHRPLYSGHPAEAYERPPFTPWPERDPDMADAAADLGFAHSITRDEQHDWAIESHRKTLAGRAALSAEIVPVAGQQDDVAARSLTPALARRTPLLAQLNESNELGLIDVAGTALQADAAAFALLVSEAVLSELSNADKAVRWVTGLAGGAAADQPPAAIVPVVQRLWEQHRWQAEDFAVIELMEAYAVQAIHNSRLLALPPERINRLGGALARGHPIGASGAILAVRAWHELQQQAKGSKALMAIAGAGGLASVAVFEKL